MGREPVLVRGRPCDWPGCAASTNPSVSFTHLLSRVIDRKEAEMRYIGLDVHREFCEVAISEEGKVRSAGRVRTRREELELFAQSLGSDDEVACPDGRPGALRRYVARRAQLVRQRSRAKNEIAAALQRNLLDRPGVYDVAGERGRRFLAGVELPDDERQTVDGCLRQIDFLDEEIAAVNRALAEAAVASEQMRRLMTVPGVNLQTAATFMACVGDIGRFRDPRKLVSYLRLDPRVRQSGEEPARHGHISKEGASEARHMLCEAAWVVVRYPSPLRAFGERIKARRGAGIATVAVARKLVVLFWHLLSKEQDYAFGRPSLTRKKLRQLELAAGAARGKGQPGVWGANKALREAELELARQAETAYRRLVSDWQPKKGAGATAGRASSKPSSGKQRGRASVPDPAP